MTDPIERRLAEATPPKRGGQTRAIRARHDAIEAALARGVTRQQVVEILAEEGIKVSLQFFGNVLYRLREEKKQGARPAKSNPSTEQTAEQATQPEPQQEAAPKPEPQTTDAWQRLDAIRNTTHDLQAMRRQHLDSLKKDKK